MRGLIRNPLKEFNVIAKIYCWGLKKEKEKMKKMQNKMNQINLKKIKTSKYYKGKTKGLRFPKDFQEILGLPKINERKNKGRIFKKR